MPKLEGTIEDATNANRSAPQTANGYRFIVCFLPLHGSAAQFRQAYGNPDGSFAEEQLPPGSYLVVAVDRQCEDLSSIDEDVNEQARTQRTSHRTRSKAENTGGP